MSNNHYAGEGAGAGGSNSGAASHALPTKSEILKKIIRLREAIEVAMQTLDVILVNNQPCPEFSELEHTVSDLRVTEKKLSAIFNRYPDVEDTEVPLGNTFNESMEADEEVLYANRSIDNQIKSQAEVPISRDTQYPVVNPQVSSTGAYFQEISSFGVKNVGVPDSDKVHGSSDPSANVNGIQEVQNLVNNEAISSSEADIRSNSIDRSREGFLEHLKHIHGYIESPSDRLFTVLAALRLFFSHEEASEVASEFFNMHETFWNIRRRADIDTVKRCINKHTLAPDILPFQGIPLRSSSRIDPTQVHFDGDQGELYPDVSVEAVAGSDGGSGRPDFLVEHTRSVVNEANRALAQPLQPELVIRPENGAGATENSISDNVPADILIPIHIPFVPWRSHEAFTVPTERPQKCLQEGREDPDWVSSMTCLEGMEGLQYPRDSLNPESFSSLLDYSQPREYLNSINPSKKPHDNTKSDVHSVLTRETAKFFGERATRESSVRRRPNHRKQSGEFHVVSEDRYVQYPRREDERQPQTEHQPQRIGFLREDDGNNTSRRGIVNNYLDSLHKLQIQSPPEKECEPSNNSNLRQKSNERAKQSNSSRGDRMRYLRFREHKPNFSRESLSKNLQQGQYGHNLSGMSNFDSENSQGCHRREVSFGPYHGGPGYLGEGYVPSEQSDVDITGETNASPGAFNIRIQNRDREESQARNISPEHYGLVTARPSKQRAAPEERPDTEQHSPLHSETFLEVLQVLDSLKQDISVTQSSLRNALSTIQYLQTQVDQLRFENRQLEIAIYSRGQRSRPRIYNVNNSTKSSQNQGASFQQDSNYRYQPNPSRNLVPGPMIPSNTNVKYMSSCQMPDDELRESHFNMSPRWEVGMQPGFSGASSRSHQDAPTSFGILNNQVPPGNRANNYWDNFRSFSRQNMLSSQYNGSLNANTSSVDRDQLPEEVNYNIGSRTNEQRNRETRGSKSCDTNSQRKLFNDQYILENIGTKNRNKHEDSDENGDEEDDDSEEDPDGN